MIHPNVLTYAADAIQIAGILPIALTILGTFVTFVGMNTILKGRLTVIDRHAMPPETNSGAPAYLLGSALMFIGSGLVFYSLWIWLRPAEAEGFLAILVQSPQGWGLLLLAFGFFTFVFGVVRLVSGNGSHQEQNKTPRTPSFRLGGVIGMLVGILLIAGGFWLAFQ